MAVLAILLVVSCLPIVHVLLIEYPMSIEKAPFMATVGKCGGAIVSRNFVLAAGKCLCMGERPAAVYTGTSWSNVPNLPKEDAAERDNRTNKNLKTSLTTPIRRSGGCTTPSCGQRLHCSPQPHTMFPASPEHQIRRIIFERDYGYCSQSRRSDFVLVELEDNLIYSHRIQPIKLYCAAHLPNQLVALGFYFPGHLYGFLNEALVNVRRGEHRYLQALNNDIPPGAVGPLASVHGDGKPPHLVGIYSHSHGKTSFFKSLDHASCNWIRSCIHKAQRTG